MSTWAPFALACPACGASVEVPLLRGMHITRLPEVHEQIVRGTFQAATCDACGHRFVVERTSVYTDFERGHYLAVEPVDCADWGAARERHRAVFDRTFTLGPDVAQALGQRLVVRLVPGLRALREKVLIFEAGLDDRAVEGLKLSVLGQRRLSPRAWVLRLLAIHAPQGHLLFGIYPRTPPATQAGPRVFSTAKAIDHATVCAADVDEVLADLPRLRGMAPWIFQDWLVDASIGVPAA